MLVHDDQAQKLAASNAEKVQCTCSSDSSSFRDYLRDTVAVMRPLGRTMESINKLMTKPWEEYIPRGRKRDEHLCLGTKQMRLIS